ncbi:protein Niban 1a isoform X2 [Lampris incognitus]|uniref:protein Niban 1a isoform X2 n=1 Tax=Lampris incognitus TaxID=2546036 RepID=UPI0024B51CC4|nr:protein Niban 1a isoform X2 [Lampris incognitus]
MGVSASSLLDESKSNYIKGQAEDELKKFSPHYRKQFSIAHFSQVEDELEQQNEKITQLLKQKEGREDGEVLYEEGVLYFDDTRKWRDRYIVVRANYCLECHESLESFMKGVPPRHKLLPTGGTVLTTEEKYMAMVDKCYPDDTSNVKEEFAPPLAGMPGQFPIYLRLPYRRDSYFCFRQEAKQDGFLSIMSDCIRHQNQDFLKKKTCEVQAFLKAIQLYRQEKGKYEAWDMLIGSDVRVMANLVMEQLLPSLEKDMLPRLNAKKTERKRVWFATVEAAYILVQEHLLEGLLALKDECRTFARQQEVLIHSDMDQILNSRARLESKLQTIVSEPAEKFCSEHVQPYLASVLEELMEPVSSGFQEGRQLCDSMMDGLCQDYQVGGATDNLKQFLANMARPNLLSCYQRISSLQEKLTHLQERFGFSNITSLIHSAQIDLQQLMENAAYTFEQLLHKAIQDNPDCAGSAIEKTKHRVLKQYDYDSSTTRKRIFQEALVAITLPHIKKNLAPSCETALQGLEQYIYADHSSFVNVENVYEGILLQTLDKEVTKVVKEAASLKKHNLFTDSRDLLSQSSRSSLSSPSASTPGSPARPLASPTKSTTEPQPSSPLVSNGLSLDPLKTSSTRVEEQQGKEEGVPPCIDTTVLTTLVSTDVKEGEAEEMQTAPSLAVSEQPASVENATNGNVIHAAPAEESSPVPTQKSTIADIPVPTDTDKVQIPVAVNEEVFAAEMKKAETEVEPETQRTDVPNQVEIALPEIATTFGSEEAKTQETVTQSESPITSPDPILLPAPEPADEENSIDILTEDTASLTVTEAEGDAKRASPHENLEIESEAPSSGGGPTVTPKDVSLDLGSEDAEAVGVSDPSSLNVSAGSQSAPSDVEYVEEVKVLQSSGNEVSMTSDFVEEERVEEEEADMSAAPPVSPDEPPENALAKTAVNLSDSPSPQAQTGAISGEGSISEDVGANACHAVTPSADVSSEPSEEVLQTQTLASSEPAIEVSSSIPLSPPLDSIKEIRDLVVEVIEVEELVQRYPSGIPTDE